MSEPELTSQLIAMLLFDVKKNGNEQERLTITTFRSDCQLRIIFTISSSSTIANI